MRFPKPVKIVLRAVLICVAAASLTGFIYAGMDWSLYLRVWKTAVLWYLNVAILTPVIYWAASRVSLERSPRLLFFLFHIFAGVIFAILWTVLAFVDLNIHPDPAINKYLNRMYLQYFNIGFFVYAAIAGWLYMVRYHHQSKLQVVREAELKRLAREAELKALKAQINPHFLFNALNSVNALVVKDPEAARAMNTRLGNILRYVLDSSEKNFVTLQQELDFVSDYLGIEKLRLGEKLSIQMNIDENLMGTRIPPMTLEPIVENAVKHGISRSADGGTITIDVRMVDQRLECRIRDTGGKMSSVEKESMLDRGVGLRNTLERLKRLYEDAFSYRIEMNSPSGCTVTLTVPSKDALS